jgi:hypothetical protein
MASVPFQVKEQAVTDTPLLLFDCQLPNGQSEHWSTHTVTVSGNNYLARVVQYNLYEVQTSSNQGVDAIPKVSISLANADSYFSELQSSSGFKGAALTLSFVFYDLTQNAPTTPAVTLFMGICNPPDEITESTFRLTAINWMNMQRVLMPQVRVQRRCPWTFPPNLAQRQEAVNGGAYGQYSTYYRCGYSPDVPGGAGNLFGNVPYTTCGYTRADCQARGMFSQDNALHMTQRFGGIEFVPSSILVRSYGEQGRHWTPVLDNVAEYNDFVPLIYGTAWYTPDIVFARNDGNLTRMEVLLGLGEINQVLTVLVNGIVIPMGQSGKNMTGTGWFNLFATGTRTGGFNLDFTDQNGNPLGDPYGSMAALSVVVPNEINNGSALPTIEVLLEGLKLNTYAADGSFAGNIFTNNPAWILLDILQRCGWDLSEIDVPSFAATAAYADQQIETQDLNGNSITIPRFQCNLALVWSRTAGDLIRGIRNASRLYLTYGTNGLLQLRVENTFALQQPTQLSWSNSSEPYSGGWPSYEFGDGSSGPANIARTSNGASSLKVTTNNITNTPNWLAVEFQDSLNGYQQDSFTLYDTNDIELTGQQITTSLMALGIPNYDQASRILAYYLDRAIQGNTFVQFQTSVKALGIQVGDLITITYLKEGFERQPFRVLKITPDVNYRTVVITAQIHDDAWYDDTNGQTTGNSGAQVQPGSEVGLPRPLLGTVLDANGDVEFGVTETAAQATDGTALVEAIVAFAVPAGIPANAPGVPLVSLSPVIGTTGGTLDGGQNCYYAVSSVSATGVEGNLSFIVRATIPAGPNTNTVTLTGLSFPSAAAKFNVFRGPSPTELFGIASSQTLAQQFTDTGLAEQLTPPPDPNFDHANFYWREELQPEYSATISSANSVGNDTLEMQANGYQGMVVRITRGQGAGQERVITSNSTTTLQLSTNWDTVPNASSYFVVAEAGWHLAATATTSPVEFQIPNLTGVTIHISGRAANALNEETPPELCTVTRWVIGGSGTSDAAAPPMPYFGLGLSTTAGGTLELSGVSFTDFTNTHTITAGTLTIYYWPELSTVPQPALAAAIGPQDTSITLTTTGTAQPGTMIQMEAEVAQVTAVLNNSTQYQITRGVDGSTAAAHGAGITEYELSQQILIVPFVQDFFGSPYSGSWSFPIPLADCRVVSAELFVTNIMGKSPTGSICLTQGTDYGLRTLSGGQFSFQVDAFLAIETGATPDIIVDTAHSVRDVYAIVGQAPSGGPVQLQINQNSAMYCTLTIADGSAVSNDIDGATLAPLQAGAQLSLDITMVGATSPGADLTVVIRL